MQARINQSLLVATTILVCSSCSADNRPESAISVSQKSYSNKEPDAASPVGYWVQDYSYPVFSGEEGSAELARALNRKLDSLKEEYTCPAGGDESFDATVETLEENLISVSYTAMWHCSAMPSPDSKEGAINLELPSLDELTLKPHFADQKQQPSFSAQVDHLYTEKMSQAGKHDSCSFSEWDYFTVESNTIVLHFGTTDPANCDTTISFPRSALKGMVSTDSRLLQ